ncbi:MAG: response regulator [Acidobacteriota bacterium]
MRPASIMVVEDERIIALDLCFKLKRLGHTVCGVAHNGEEAIRLAGELRPDVILLDIILEGGMDGIDALEAIRRSRPVPALFVSACADEATRSRAQAAGCSGFVHKPVDLDQLADRVRSVLELAARQ